MKASPVTIRIREEAKKSPGLSKTALAKKLHLPPQQVYNALAKSRRTPTLRPTGDRPAGTTANKAANLPEFKMPIGDGISIKLTNGDGRMVGTIKATKAGISFARPNAKKQDQRHLSYDVLDRLMELGLVTQ